MTNPELTFTSISSLKCTRPQGCYGQGTTPPNWCRLNNLCFAEMFDTSDSKEDSPEVAPLQRIARVCIQGVISGGELCGPAWRRGYKEVECQGAEECFKAGICLKGYESN